MEEEGIPKAAGAIGWRIEDRSSFSGDARWGKGDHRIGDDSIALLCSVGRKRRMVLRLAEDSTLENPAEFTSHTWTFVRQEFLPATSRPEMTTILPEPRGRFDPTAPHGMLLV